MQGNSLVNVAVVANCQARPLAETLKRLSSRVQICSVVITHLANESDHDSAMEDLLRADFVFAQAVQPNYPVSFLRTSHLREVLGKRLVTWPNVFFKGQCPDLCYLTTPQGRRVLGPLGEYHCRPIYEGWRKGRSQAATKADLLKGDTWVHSLAQTVATSFADLNAREKELDAVISHKIEEQWRDRRLFFTFNHPVQSLLTDLATQVLTRANLPSDGRVEQNAREPLDRLIPALLPVVAETLRLKLQPNLETKGCRVETEPGVKIFNDTVVYSLDELVETSFRCLDAQIKPDDTLRIT
jgi:hypothetical protein